MTCFVTLTSLFWLPLTSFVFGVDFSADYITTVFEFHQIKYKIWSIHFRNRKILIGYRFFSDATQNFEMGQLYFCLTLKGKYLFYIYFLYINKKCPNAFQFSKNIQTESAVSYNFLLTLFLKGIQYQYWLSNLHSQ